MTTALWIAVGFLAFALVFWRLLMPSIEREVDRASRSKDLAPVLQHIARLRTGAQPVAYDLAIKRLWDSYQRELAIPLVRELARNHGTAHIAQYWLDRVIKVEPALAKDHLGQEFIETYYQPGLAAQCGRVG